MKNTVKSAYSQRQLKVGENIKHAFVEIFLKEKFFDTDIANISITVSEVKVNSNLRHAYIYVMSLGNSVKEQTLVNVLQSNSKMLRNMLGKKLHLKYLPEIIFKYDDTFENYTKIENLLSNARL